VTLAVDRYELGPLATNCYVVRAARDVHDAVVVDPGDDAAALRLELARTGAACTAILVTHTHFDHIGAVADLAEGLAVPVYAPAGEVDVLARADEIYRPYGVSIRPWPAAIPVAAGERLDLAGIEWETVAAPGHTVDHVAYAAGGALFSGDVLFAGGVGRVDLPGGDWDRLIASIEALLERFPPDTPVYPGHGPPTTLGAELAQNPFLAELRA
jgi:glyoxylase-like metal-dependent hydrolase (beta-lactamase superfamily II)